MHVRHQTQALDMLDRLMGRPILAEPDTVMGHDIDGPRVLDRGQPHRTTAIVGKHQERAAIGNDATVQCHPVHRCRHAEFADTIIDIATGIIVFCQRLGRRSFGIV